MLVVFCWFNLFSCFNLFSWFGLGTLRIAGNISISKTKGEKKWKFQSIFREKGLGERTMLVGGVDLVQRDLYSAYLAFCINQKENIVCRATAVSQWPGARLRLDAAVKQLISAKSEGFIPSSAGVDKFKYSACGAFAA